MAAGKEYCEWRNWSKEYGGSIWVYLYLMYNILRKHFIYIYIYISYKILFILLKLKEKNV